MPEFEEVSSIAQRVITLLDRQRHHNSDATDQATAFAELAKLNSEVREKYGSYPDGWTEFYQRANTYLELAERHRGDGGAWARRLDDVRSRVMEAHNAVFAAEQGRNSAGVAAKEGKALLLNREAVKQNAAIYRQAKAQAAKTGQAIQFVG